MPSERTHRWCFSLVDQDEEQRRIRSETTADRYRRDVLAEFDRTGEAVP